MDKLEFKRFFRACNPAKTLNISDPQDKKYYIDFSGVRAAEILEELGQNIVLSHPDPTCQLFTGHIGCGKSTELLRLKSDLEQQGFHVVYFESSQDMDMGDVDISDILLAIARQVEESLGAVGINLKGSYFNNLLQEAADFLQTPIELGGVEAEVSFGIGKLTAKTKESPQLRSRLRQYLEPKTEGLINALNKELLIPAGEAIARKGGEGLVAIVDNLDRVDNRPTSSGKTLPEYLFADRGEQLARLRCHLVYTIPLVLMFSNELAAIKNRFGGNRPAVLPMVPVRDKNGSICEEGMQLLREMVLARAFPNLAPDDRFASIEKLFDSPDTLDYLCRMSGGHVRNLLRWLHDCLRKRNPLPIAAQTLETVIGRERDDLLGTITDDEWELLRKVRSTHKVTGEQESQTLLRSLFVFEYRNGGRWFDVNPLLEEAPELQ